VATILRAVAIIVCALLFHAGCAAKQYRVEKLRFQYPQWDEVTIQKVASRKVEIGMTAEMAAAALGKPDDISREGDTEKWSYAIFVGDYQPREKFVYFVYLENGVVVKTAGDRSKLSYFTWGD